MLNIEIGEFFTKFLSSSNRSLIVVGDPMMDALSLLLLMLLLPLLLEQGGSA